MARKIEVKDFKATYMQPVAQNASTASTVTSSTTRLKVTLTVSDIIPKSQAIPLSSSGVIAKEAN